MLQAGTSVRECRAFATQFLPPHPGTVATLKAVDLEQRRSFWTGYQPGFRFSGADVGSAQFFREVERHRYALEPHIPEVVGFSAWAGKDVLEAGCGIATDGLQFARAGARYTGVDFSATAIELARHRFELEGIDGAFVNASITQLPFPDTSFDLVYSHGVIHHLPQTDAVVREFHRVLRPGGTALVMVYHRDSFNYRFTILVLRRSLALTLAVPGGAHAVSTLTGERRDALEGHQRLLAEHGLAYLRDRSLFLSHNTDGPENPLSKVYTRDDVRMMFAGFADVDVAVRYLNLRSYPGGERMAQSSLARRLERRWGWHLYVVARR
jgi:SAM-dependent methyltransferase